jgi:proteasome lid subunit RPN8/RPN11
MPITCPNCDNGELSLNHSCFCSNCGANYVMIGESVYIRQDALQKAANIVEETDKRLAKIVQERGVDDLVGNEGEEAGVISGRKSGSAILINDFFVTGTPGSNGFSVEPILALDESRERSDLLKVIRKLYAERKLEVPILSLLPLELEAIRKEAEMDQKGFAEELKRLIEAGQECKVGTFHSHESSASCPSDQDIRIIKLKDELVEGHAFGRNDAIEVILSEHLIVLEKGSAREIGRIALTNSAFYDSQNDE